MREDELQNSEEDGRLARQLRQAARDDQPAFSEALHGRIMQALRPLAEATASESKPATIEPAPSGRRNGGGSRRSRRAIYWLSIASGLLAMAFGAWWVVGRSSNVIPGDPQRVADTKQDRTDNQVVKQKPPATDSNAPGDDTDSLADDFDSIDASSLLSSVGYSWDDVNRTARATAQLVLDQSPLETSSEDWGLASEQ